jgi:hypothetical protein
VVEDVVGVGVDLLGRAKHPVEEEQANGSDHEDEDDVADPPQDHDETSWSRLSAPLYVVSL